MQITVKIYASLRFHLPEAEDSSRLKIWDVPQNATVAQVIDRLRLPKEVHVTILRNNNSVDQKTILKEGDILHILPQMGGG